MSRRNFTIALLAIVPLSAAELKRETLDAWDQYLDAANARMEQRAKGTFLWAAESPDRLRQVHAGEVIVTPMTGHGSKSVPAGLIHHWIGAAFISGARVDDVVTLIRSYDRYTEFYKPSVIGAKTLSRQPDSDRFNVIVLDKAMFMKRALDSEYQSRFAQVDDRKWYSVAQTTRVQELDGIAQGSPRRIPEGEGSGYIWRLCTISRYEERDGGVYIETEAIALSRPIPATLHFLVEPIVRRVSRSSLTTSLEQTRDATRSFAVSARAQNATPVANNRQRILPVPVQSLR
jgi:hypothetical protein